MKKEIFYLLLISIFASCYSSKIATKNVVKAQTNFPPVVRNACALYYPGRDSISREIIYSPGRIDTVENFVEIDCNDYFSDTVIVRDTVPKLVKVKCPPSTVRVDTFFDRNFHVITDDAETLSLRDSIGQLNENLTVSRDDLGEYKTKYKTALIWLLIVGLIAAVLFYFLGRKLFKF